jgi:tRNA G18 (ribose-2'-O)-methylase SpoU
MSRGSPEAELTRTFYAAYRNPSVAVLEGFHPARHAVEFGASLTTAVTYDRDRLLHLAERLAPEVVDAIMGRLLVVDRERFVNLSQRSLSSPLLSIAPRPARDTTGLWQHSSRPVVFLDRPRNPGNVGAVIRVAAAADVDAVVVSGTVDPWSPVVLRSGTGLQFALAVERGDFPEATGRPIVAVDMGGEAIGASPLPPGAVLVVGGERYGLSADLRRRADRTIGVPMRPGVSSLNLATALSAVLFGWRASTLARTGTPPW